MPAAQVSFRAQRGIPLRLRKGARGCSERIDEHGHTPSFQLFASEFTIQTRFLAPLTMTTITICNRKRTNSLNVNIVKCRIQSQHRG